MFGETVGAVRLTLRLEGLCVLLAALFVYSRFELAWGSFALYFLLPDISLLGYLAGARSGAIAYNFAHSYIGAFICGAIGSLADEPMGVTAAIIWFAHIGFDRALGFGLKYSAGFHMTHLGKIGGIAGTQDLSASNQNIA